jgi:hypothetical protein
MRKLAILLFSWLFATVASAQFLGSNATATIDPSWIMPPGKTFVNRLTMPGKYAGSTSETAIVLCIGPASASPGAGECDASTVGNYTPHPDDGAFRITCRTSHFAFDDPIVWPGHPGMSHLHVFFGNDTTSSYTDLSNMAHVGTSTCHGGLFNRSGYWAPAMIYHCPHPTISGCTASRDGEIQIPTTNEIYYKTGYKPADLANMQWPPEGFRMIGGSATSTTLQGGHFFSCLGYDPAIGGINNVNYTPARIPSSAEAAALAWTCTDLLQAVLFPQCWNGVDLDSPDHKSHLTDPTLHSADDQNYCDTPGFSHLFPKISYNLHYAVRNIVDLDFFRLTSDLPETTGVTQTSTDTTHIKLASTEPATDGYYNYGMLFIGGAGRQILAWDGTNKIATLASAFSTSLPPAGTTYAVRNANGITTHGDWVGGWDQTNPVDSSNPSSLTVTNSILAKCLKTKSDCHDSDIGDANPAHDRTSTPSAPWWYYLP